LCEGKAASSPRHWISLIRSGVLIIYACGCKIDLDFIVGADRNRYEYLDQQKKRIEDAKLANPGQSFQESLQARIAAFGGEDELSWIYGNDIEKVWGEYLQESELKWERKST
jgi:hypothetical protein